MKALGFPNIFEALKNGVKNIGLLVEIMCKSLAMNRLVPPQ